MSYKAGIHCSQKAGSRAGMHLTKRLKLKNRRMRYLQLSMATSSMGACSQGDNVLGDSRPV